MPKGPVSKLTPTINPMMITGTVSAITKVKSATIIPSSSTSRLTGVITNLSKYPLWMSVKNYMSLYLMNIYAEAGAEQWFVEGFKDRGKRLNMGKSCVRFKKLDDLPIDLVGMAVARTSVAQFIELYEMSRRKS